MKKQNKFVEKLTLELIEQEIKKQNYSKEKQEEINTMVKESFEKSNQPLTESKESIKRKFENSFYVAKGREYTSAMSLMETQQHAEIFKEVLFEKLNNGELKVYFDDSLVDDGSIFFAYKNNNKLIFEILYNDEKNNKFEIDFDFLTFTYPKEKKMSLDEQSCLLKKILKYNEIDDIFEISKRMINEYNNLDKKVIKQRRKEIFTGFFWRYGILIVAFLNFCISSIICLNIDGLKDYGPYIIFPSFGLPLFIMGLDYILACAFKWKHILLVEQSVNHVKMDPDRASWSNFESKDIIIVGAIFVVFGLLLILFPLLNFLK